MGQESGHSSQRHDAGRLTRVQTAGTPEQRAWAIASQAAADALSGRTPDLTEGATAYNHRPQNDAGVNPVIDRNPALLQYGPFDNAVGPKPNHYIDIYGKDDRSNGVYSLPPFDSLDAPYVFLPRMPQRE